MWADTSQVRHVLGHRFDRAELVRTVIAERQLQLERTSVGRTIEAVVDLASSGHCQMERCSVTTVTTQRLSC